MNWLRKFMVGRYGMDQLSLTMVLVSLGLTVLSRITKINLFYTISLATIIFAYYRVFSRNVGKRYAENNKFLRLTRPISKKLRNIALRIKGSKDYKYFKCGACNQLIRVPRKKGKISITCPKCQKKMIRRT